MKQKSTLCRELEDHGFAGGAKFVSEEKTPWDTDDLHDLYDKNLWNFSAAEERVCAFPACRLRMLC